MAPRKKASATVVDEAVALPANDIETVKSKTTKSGTKKTQVTKVVEQKNVEQNDVDDVVAVPAKVEVKSKRVASKKATKQTEPIDTETNGDIEPPAVVETKSKRLPSKRIAKQNDAIAKSESVKTVNGATDDAKKSSARGKKQVESPKVAPKTKPRKVEPKAPEETSEAGPSKPEKKSAKAKPTKQSANDKEKDVIEEIVVPETKGKRSARKAIPVVDFTIFTDPVVEAEQPIEVEKPTKGRAKKAADTAKSTEKTTKSKDWKEEAVIDDTVEENNETDSAKGRKRKAAKVIVDKSPIKKKKETVAVDNVDGGLSSKGSDSSKKRKAAADSTTNDTGDDELVTKRKKPSKQEAKEQAKTKMNPTTSDLTQIDYEVDKEFTLKIVSWNVAGLRALVNKGGFDYFEHEKPDIICLQEIKCLEEEVPPEAKLKGYHPYWCSTPGGRGGVAILSKSMPYNVEKNIGDEEMDEEGRIITAEYSKFFLVCVYVPNAGRKLVNLDRRLRWNKLFEKHLTDLKAKKPVIICGDMNVAHAEIDLANPKTNRKNAGFSDEERAGMTNLLELGFIDTFRELYPSQEKAYSFWTYMGNARSKNVGWRLDYSIVSENLKPKIVDSFMRSPVLGSDHCPIVLLMNL